MGFITRGYIMEHIENMHADLKLAKKNPGWFLNLLCKTGCKFTTVTILHIQEKNHGKNCDYLSWKLAHIYTAAGTKCQVFLCRPSCTKALKALRRRQLYQMTKLGTEAASFFYFLGAETVVENGWQMLLTSIQDVCKTFGQECKKRKHLAYIIGIVSHLTSELRSFFNILVDQTLLRWHMSEM